MMQDFRSKEGLYSLIGSEYKAKGIRSLGAASPRSVKGKDLFDASLWKDEHSTSVFYTFIASLRKKVKEEVLATTSAHRFIRQLRDQRKLVRCYTQNIDGLEARDDLLTDLERGRGSKSRFTKKALQLPSSTASPLPGSISDPGCEVVQLHGDLDVLRCTLCSDLSSWEDNDCEQTFLSGNAPRCQKCESQNQRRQDRGMRGTAVGSLRPNIILYGEEHPSADKLSSITTCDLKCNPDVLLVLGTSLKVHGLKVLVREFAKAVHKRTGKKGVVIFVNLTRPPGSVWNDVFNYWVSMDCDDWVHDFRVRQPGLWLSQSVLEAKEVKESNVPLNSHTFKRTVQTMEDKENDIPPSSVSLNKTTTFEENDSPRVRPIGKRKRGFANIVAPMTPSKNQQLTTPPQTREQDIHTARRFARNDVFEQNFTISTPPPSREQDMHAVRHSLKNYVPDEKNLTISTPSKRRKRNIDIWEDDECGALNEPLRDIHEDPEGPQFERIPLQMPTTQRRLPAKTPVTFSASEQHEYGKTVPSTSEVQAGEIDVSREKSNDDESAMEEQNAPQGSNSIRVEGRMPMIQVVVPSRRGVERGPVMPRKKRKRI